MATLREYFDTDFTRCLSLHKPWVLRSYSGDSDVTIIARISHEYSANAKYWSFFIPSEMGNESFVDAIFNESSTKLCVLGPEGDSVEVTTSFAEYSDKMSSSTLMFTGRIFLYVDWVLSKESQHSILEKGRLAGFHVVIRDSKYAEERSKWEKPMAFISHDSRDKDDIVRALALELQKNMCHVWYDEYSLKVGDSLRENIENGLKEAQTCIVVLSPNFLSNGGWGKKEFDSIYTREIIQKQNVMLPIWHNVTQEQVYEYSPSLADRVGLLSSLGVKKLASELVTKIKKSK